MKLKEFVETFIRRNDYFALWVDKGDKASDFDIELLKINDRKLIMEWELINYGSEDLQNLEVTFLPMAIIDNYAECVNICIKHDDIDNLDLHIRPRTDYGTTMESENCN